MLIQIKFTSYKLTKKIIYLLNRLYKPIQIWFKHGYHVLYSNLKKTCSSWNSGNVYYQIFLPLSKKTLKCRTRPEIFTFSCPKRFPPSQSVLSSSRVTKNPLISSFSHSQSDSKIGFSFQGLSPSTLYWVNIRNAGFELETPRAYSSIALTRPPHRGWLPRHLFRRHRQKSRFFLSTS